MKRKPRNEVSFRTTWATDTAYELRDNARGVVVEGPLPVFYVCDVTHGFYAPAKGYVVIPEFCMAHSRVVGKRWRLLHKLTGYATHYVAHELAHVLDPSAVGVKPRKRRESWHGKSFYETLVALCPPDYIHYEADAYRGRARSHLYPLLTPEQLARVKDFLARVDAVISGKRKKVNPPRVQVTA